MAMKPSDEELRGIGRIAIGAGSLDLIVSEILFALINPQRIGVGTHLVGDPTSLQLKRIADTAVYALEDDRQLAAELTEWAGRARMALEDRNRAIHAGYYRGEAGDAPLAWRRGGALHGTRLTARQLAALADTLEQLTDEANHLWSRISEILKPSY
jgi:hypothetical protein